MKEGSEKARSKTPYVITKAEFLEIFGLDPKCEIDKKTLTTFTKQIRGAYLLYKEILDVKNKRFKNIDGTQIRGYFEPYEHGFQRFVYTLGSKSKFRVDYIDQHNRSTPFWAYTKYHDTDVNTRMKNSAYRIFEVEFLNKIGYKYSKYGFKILYRDYATTSDEAYRSHPNQSIWWDGIEFDSLYYKEPDGRYEKITDYDIEQVISNRAGSIWNGEILKPIQKIIDSVK